MADKQIQTINNRDYALARRSRPRGLVGQVSMVLLEPGAFFRALPFVESSRQWVGAALLILALVGFSAVRQDALLKEKSSGGLTGLSGFPGTTGMESSSGGGGGGGGVMVGPGISSVSPGAFGGGETPTIPTEPTATPNDVSGAWTTAIVAAASVILGWFILSLLLCEVTLFNGAAPRLAPNFQIAIWASVPIGLMAALQLLYYAAGGTVGEPGISGLLARWDGYAGLPTFTRSLLLSLTSHMTLFWLWSLALIYVGGRMALRGKSWAVMLVVIAWMVIVIVAPVLTGAITAPEKESALTDLVGPDGQPLNMPGGTGDDPFAQMFGITPEVTAEASGENIMPPEGTPESSGENIMPPEMTPPAGLSFTEHSSDSEPEMTPEATPPGEAS